MINKEETLTLSDGKEYYVINSIMYENENYIIIGEIDNAKDEIIGNAIIMLNDYKNENLVKVTNPELLLKLAVTFGNDVGAFDIE